MCERGMEREEEGMRQTERVREVILGDKENSRDIQRPVPLLSARACPLSPICGKVSLTAYTVPPHPDACQRIISPRKQMRSLSLSYTHTAYYNTSDLTFFFFFFTEHQNGKER